MHYFIRKSNLENMTLELLQMNYLSAKYYQIGTSFPALLKDFMVIAMVILIAYQETFR